MRLSQYLEADLVVLDLDTSGVDDTIGAFVARLASTNRVDDPDLVERALLDRERSHTTSLGNGVALPHATIAGLASPLLMVGVSPVGVPFGPDNGAAGRDRLFFLLLSPMEQAGTHIKLLARIVRLVRSPDFVESLVQADSGPALVEAIAREDELHV
jgi:mannitol/fructose-specific phosphotransferase system IIA component (Ntr-type)